MFHNSLQDEILVSLILVLIMGTISSGSQMKGATKYWGEYKPVCNDSDHIEWVRGKINPVLLPRNTTKK